MGYEVRKNIAVLHPPAHISRIMGPPTLVGIVGLKGDCSDTSVHLWSFCNGHVNVLHLVSVYLLTCVFRVKYYTSSETGG